MYSHQSTENCRDETSDEHHHCVVGFCSPYCNGKKLGAMPIIYPYTYTLAIGKIVEQPRLPWPAVLSSDGSA
jgi:hypothetical protein